MAARPALPLSTRVGRTTACCSEPFAGSPGGSPFVAFVDAGGLPLALWSAARQPLLAQHGPYRPLPMPRLLPRAGHPASDLAVDAWYVALQRWLDTWCEASLAEIVLRAATVQHTRTHLDLFLPLDEVDIRIRRVALDVDPQYVPWLGCVVTFHMG